MVRLMIVAAPAFALLGAIGTSNLLHAYSLEARDPALDAQSAAGANKEDVKVGLGLTWGAEPRTPSAQATGSSWRHCTGSGLAPAHHCAHPAGAQEAQRQESKQGRGGPAGLPAQLLAGRAGHRYLGLREVHAALPVSAAPVCLGPELQPLPRRLVSWGAWPNTPPHRAILLLPPGTRRWVTSEAYSSPSIVLSSGSGPNRVILDDFREAYAWLRHNTKPDAKILSW